MDVRRSQAVGVLARRQLTLDLTGGQATATAAATAAGSVVKPRQVVLHVHLNTTTVPGTATREGHGLISVDQVAAWCDPATQVQVRRCELPGDPGVLAG